MHSSRASLTCSCGGRSSEVVRNRRNRGCGLWCGFYQFWFAVKRQLNFVARAAGKGPKGQHAHRSFCGVSCVVWAEDCGAAQEHRCSWDTVGSSMLHAYNQHADFST